MRTINELVLSKDLISIPSITPVDAGAINFLAKKLKSLGFKCKILEFKKEDYSLSDIPRFTEWTIQNVNMFRGAVSSLLRNDGYHFLFLGSFIERADNSARLLDVKYYVLLPSSTHVGSTLDNLQWSVLLRSLSSFRAFRWAYDGDITSSKIADFFISCSKKL